MYGTHPVHLLQFYCEDGVCELVDAGCENKALAATQDLKTLKRQGEYLP
jgi:hypothetical protein